MPSLLRFWGLIRWLSRHNSSFLLLAGYTQSMSSNLIKICPACQTENAAALSICFRCGESIVEQPYIDKVSLKMKDREFENNWFLEELLTPTFWVCVPASILSALIGISTLGSPLSPILFLGAVILGGMPFYPGDPVGNFIRNKVFAEAEKQDQKKLEPPSDKKRR